jgi:hypothetical protein
MCLEKKGILAMVLKKRGFRIFAVKDIQYIER